MVAHIWRHQLAIYFWSILNVNSRSYLLDIVDGSMITRPICILTNFCHLLEHRPFWPPLTRSSAAQVIMAWLSYLGQMFMRNRPYFVVLVTILSNNGYFVIDDTK